MTVKRGHKRTFGELEPRKQAETGKIISWLARYSGPDLTRHSRAYGDKLAAEAWLSSGRIFIDRGEWKPPKVRAAEERMAAARAITFAEWATRSVAGRKPAGIDAP